jgi:hypothetical protein
MGGGGTVRISRRVTGAGFAAGWRSSVKEQK